MLTFNVKSVEGLTISEGHIDIAEAVDWIAAAGEYVVASEDGKERALTEQEIAIERESKWKRFWP